MSSIIVTGGASFIGSHLVERLLKQGHEVFIYDDLSSGSFENLRELESYKGLNTFTQDLRNASIRMLSATFKSIKPELLFHLAADHGGRGYVETRQVACSNNFALDNNVLQAAINAGIPKVILASSGCIYPLNLQEDSSSLYYLREEEGGPPFWPDGLYGLAKLAAEETLRQACVETGLEGTSCRFFTVYGPRAKENHAVISFIARAFIKQDPYILWGDGTQVRNWTYVDDIVKGMMLATELSDYNVVNLGTVERITVYEAAIRTIEIANELYYEGSYHPKIEYDTNKPVGPLNRVADNSHYFNLGGDPLVKFEDGLARTLKWYFETKDREYMKANFERLQIDKR